MSECMLSPGSGKPKITSKTYKATNTSPTWRDGYTYFYSDDFVGRTLGEDMFVTPYGIYAQGYNATMNITEREILERDGDNGIKIKMTYYGNGSASITEVQVYFID